MLANGSSLAYNAKFINEGNTKLYYGPDFMFMASDNQADAAERIISRYCREIEESGIDRVQILSPFRSEGAASGSEYETVIMPLLKAHSIMLYRNLLYTGITRAKKRVVLIGQKQVLFMAIHRNEISKRNTLLGARIGMYFKAYARRAGIQLPNEAKKELKHAG